MGRPRSYEPLKNSDGRYMIHVYCPGVKKPARRYLGTKDKAKADVIYSLLESPLRRGNLAEIDRRLAVINGAANESLDKLKRSALFFALDAKSTWREDWSVWIEEHYPEEVKEWDEANDDELQHVNLLWSALKALDDKGRDDLIKKFAGEFLDWNSPDSDLLKKIRNQAGSILEVEENKEPTNPDPDCDKHLSDCYTVWEEFKLRTSNAPGDKHIRQLRQAFLEFVELTNDPPVNRLTKRHFLDWEKYLDHKTNDRGAASYKIRVFAVKTIIETAIAKSDEQEFNFPQNLERWLRLFSVERKAPGKEHKSRLPLDTFRLLLSKAEELGSVDVETLAESIAVNENDRTSKMRRTQKIRTMTQKKREGLMWSAVLRLSVNVGCDNVDVSRLKLTHLSLDDDLPLFALPRIKVAKKVGEPVDRYTPLLPATVAAIRKWVQYERPNADDLLFRNDIGNPWDDGKLSHAFGRLRKSCGLPQGVWFKHCRNSGPSVAAESRRPRILKDDRDTFLGHTVKGQCRFYEDGIGKDLLIDMVNVIGREYFAGEQVGFSC